MRAVLRRAWMALVLGGAASLAACGGGSSGGGCIVPSPVRTPAWDACHDGWSVDECTSKGGMSSSSSCAELGFTVTCPADGSNTFRRSSYSC